ncbi:hypothetical protein HK097_008670 [Rhizophlyctis rosea]|uniref:Arginine biosynthesis bifunctional protein ArgJ, mitochondrial n=1 Tax=Rhizophlyctis rosea TaxID=64517 RepID=A0AAD5X0Z0_9FUNG|nr:hypothetical protein HK097_008670 [Rhizophlyctis rosea]
MMAQTLRVSLKTVMPTFFTQSFRQAASRNFTTMTRRAYSTPTHYPKQHLIPTSGIYPKGFKAGSLATNVKKTGAKDLTLIISKDHPCTAAAVFTTNQFCAAPVQVSREIVGKSAGADNHGAVRAVVVNSGCANACTGEEGLTNAWKMSKQVDDLLGGGSKPSTVVMSTGVIGQPLDMKKISDGINKLVGRVSEDHEGWLAAAEGIMTTDTFPKLQSKEFSGPNGTYRMAGWCKGAGMIHPNMATMLSSVFTDVAISKECLDAALKYAADRSFNAISIDGDTSTNDTFAVLANGAAGGPVIDDLHSAAFTEFRDNLTTFSAELAKLIVRDGEGATKFVDIQVEGARSFEEAKHIASTVATSPLVKTAIYGKDANWGRIVCAVGYAGVPIVPERVNLHFGPGDGTLDALHLFKDGAPFDVNEEKAAAILEKEDLVIRIDLGLGSAKAQMYTCDFSHEYVSINADYRS